MRLSTLTPIPRPRLAARPSNWERNRQLQQSQQLQAEQSRNARKPLRSAEHRLAFDEVRKRTRPGAFSRTKRAEADFALQLRKIARHVGDIVNGVPQDDPEFADKVKAALDGYAKVIEPWAERTSARMLADVSHRDARAWEQHSADMGRALRLEIETAPTGPFLAAVQAEQIALIKSLPIEAGERVQKLTLEALFDGTRATQIAKEIADSGGVSISRANVIARTQVSTVASGLVEARATHVGSEGYVWRTSRDGDVRKSHRKMEGKFVAWNAPPTLDGLTGHAGALPNCRCFPEPVIPNQ